MTDIKHGWNQNIYTYKTHTSRIILFIHNYNYKTCTIKSNVPLNIINEGRLTAELAGGKGSYFT